MSIKQTLIKHHADKSTPELHHRAQSQTMDSRISGGHGRSRRRPVGEVARPEGFEPPTSSFEGLHSIQLSYERAVVISLPKDCGDENSRPGRAESGDVSLVRDDFVNREPIVITLRDLCQLTKKSRRVEDRFATWGNVDDSDLPWECFPGFMDVLEDLWVDRCAAWIEKIKNARFQRKLEGGDVHVDGFQRITELIRTRIFFDIRLCDGVKLRRKFDADDFLEW